jgi:hypothetical protein
MQWLQCRRERVEVVRQQRNRRDRGRDLDELLRRGRLLRRQQHVDDVVAELTGSNVRPIARDGAHHVEHAEPSADDRATLLDLDPRLIHGHAVAEQA